MDNKIVGSDLDGTFLEHTELWGITDLIITGNSWEIASGVMEELGRTDIPVFFNTVKSGEENLSNIVAHKADIIKKVGVIRFFEDQQQQVNLLQALCPNCKIIQVFENRTAI